MALFVINKMKFSIFLVLLIITLLAGCGGGGEGTQAGGTGSVTLAWSEPTSYIDGSPVAGTIGYKVYYGTSPRTYNHVVDVQNRTSCSIGALSSGRTYYFAITAYDASGIESDYSNELITTI
jgi:fibronectin type 3 domain-containing protein